MRSKQIMYILDFFDICGYSTGSSAVAQHRKMQMLLQLVQILLACYFTMYQFHLTTIFNKLVGPLQTANEMLQYDFALCTCWLIVFESIFYRREHQQFWIIFERINVHLWIECNSFRNFIYKMFEYFPVSFVLYAVSFIYRGHPTTEGVFVFHALITICELRTFYYVFCLEIVNWQLQIIERELMVKNHDLKYMKMLNHHYGCIVALTELLNVIFGWSQFASILFEFYALLTDLNWCYASFELFPIFGYTCE